MVGPHGILLCGSMGNTGIGIAKAIGSVTRCIGNTTTVTIMATATLMGTTNMIGIRS